MKKLGLMITIILVLILGGCERKIVHHSSKKNTSLSETSSYSNNSNLLSTASNGHFNSSINSKHNYVSIDTNTISDKNKDINTESSDVNSNLDSGISLASNSNYYDNTKHSVSYKLFSTYNIAKSFVLQNGYKTAQETKGLPIINLGSGIIGTLDSGAGQRYLHWNEGRWSFTVHGDMMNGQNPIPVAKRIVSILNNIYLPAPKDYGVGIFDIYSNNYMLMWQENKKVYIAKGNSPKNVIQKCITS